MTNLPASFLKVLEEQAYLPQPKIERKLVSTDGTVKYLFRFDDGELVETVLMNYRHGTSVCLSTQAGCRQGCAFCASTLGGLNRNLTASEILSQFFTAQTDSGCKISNIVLMGTGEPLDNFDHTVRFLQLVNCPDGPNIGMRHISLSTCGLVPRILQLAELGFPLTLSISLHATTDDMRDRLMPVNRKYPLQMLMQACKEYFSKTGRRISVEYVMIKDMNVTQRDAERLISLTNGFLSHINLIPVNFVEERGFHPPSEAEIKRFCELLRRKGAEVTVRRKLGNDINASCGQLRHSCQKENKKG